MHAIETAIEEAFMLHMRSTSLWLPKLEDVCTAHNVGGDLPFTYAQVFFIDKNSSGG